MVFPVATAARMAAEIDFGYQSVAEEVALDILKLALLRAVYQLEILCFPLAGTADQLLQQGLDLPLGPLQVAFGYSQGIFLS